LEGGAPAEDSTEEGRKGQTKAEGSPKSEPESESGVLSRELTQAILSLRRYQVRGEEGRIRKQELEQILNEQSGSQEGTSEGGARAEDSTEEGGKAQAGKAESSPDSVRE